MDLAAGWVCVAFLWVSQFAFVRKDFRVATATIPYLSIKRIAPDGDLMS